MKRRGWRVALTVAALGLALVVGLVACNWATVRDHAEAWWFQVTRETTTIDPCPVPSGDCATLKGQSRGEGRSDFGLQSVLSVLACSGHSVIHDLPPRSLIERGMSWPPPDPSFRFWVGSSWPVQIKSATPDLAKRILRANGWRVLEQRFPSRAYVVVCPPIPRVEVSAGE